MELCEQPDLTEKLLYVSAFVRTSGRGFKRTEELFIEVPFIGAVSYLTLVVSPFCIAFAVVWAVYRNISFAWIGQDVLLYAICQCVWCAVWMLQQIWHVLGLVVLWCELCCLWLVSRQLTIFWRKLRSTLHNSKIDEPKSMSSLCMPSFSKFMQRSNNDIFLLSLLQSGNCIDNYNSSDRVCTKSQGNDSESIKSIKITMLNLKLEAVEAR
ncbi:hypothetical protein HYC85_026572 [Camellia sinensis]|uniref:Uncharacterized protein n=1 Tax=Camellia sinensis TaxID=4442 RepID=A0A7J7G3X8_CAMSI|nr:hypothetical protein HYC85_026572 [Camellia sinensis]